MVPHVAGVCLRSHHELALRGRAGARAASCRRLVHVDPQRSVLPEQAHAPRSRAAVARGKRARVSSEPASGITVPRLCAPLGSRGSRPQRRGTPVQAGRWRVLGEQSSVLCVSFFPFVRLCWWGVAAAVSVCARSGRQQVGGAGVRWWRKGVHGADPLPSARTRACVCAGRGVGWRGRALAWALRPF